jgi:hypothetical protein
MTHKNALRLAMLVICPMCSKKECCGKDKCEQLENYIHNLNKSNSKNNDKI